MGPDHEKMVEIVRGALPRDAIVVKDATVSSYVWANRHLPVYEPRTSMRPVSAAIGPGLPLAIGASIGTGRRTLVVHGDGGLMLSVGRAGDRRPAGTAADHVRVQRSGLRDPALHPGPDARGPADGGRPAHPGLRRAGPVDGDGGVRAVTTVDEFASALGRAVEHDGPTLIDVDITQLAADADRAPSRPSTRRR